MVRIDTPQTKTEANDKSSFYSTHTRLFLDCMGPITPCSHLQLFETSDLSNQPTALINFKGVCRILVHLADKNYRYQGKANKSLSENKNIDFSALVHLNSEYTVL